MKYLFNNIWYETESLKILVNGLLVRSASSLIDKPTVYQEVTLEDGTVLTEALAKDKQAQFAIEDLLNAEAVRQGFDDIKSAAIRAGYSGPYQTVGIAMAQWMDACWFLYFDQLQGQGLTVEEVLAQLPVSPFQKGPD